MPPSAVDPASTERPASLDDASARLEAALARLEALIEVGPLQSERFRAGSAAPEAVWVEPGDGEVIAAVRGELVTARARERTLETAVVTASDALDQAMSEIRQMLHGATDPAPNDGDDDSGEQAELDLGATRLKDMPP